MRLILFWTSSKSSRSTLGLCLDAKGFRTGAADSNCCFRVLRSSLRTIVSRIREQNFTAGRVCYNCCAVGEEQVIRRIFEDWVKVCLKQLMIGFSPSTNWFFLLVATLISCVLNELKLLVTKVRTVVSLMNASVLVTLCSEPANSTKLSIDSS